MVWLRAVFTALVVVAVEVPAQTFPLVDDFDTGLAGWTFSNEDGEWDSAGGNPGGFIRFEELHSNQTLARAPLRFLGNWSPLDDGLGEVTFDFCVFKTGDYEGGGELFVQLSGPGGMARANVTTFEGVMPWRRYVVPVSVDRWTVLSGAWGSLLENVAEFGITIDIFDSTSLGETNGLDNVAVGRACPADFDGDGFMSGVDFDAYVGAYEAGELSADYDGDGFLSGDDFDRFVQDFEHGCG